MIRRLVHVLPYAALAFAALAVALAWWSDDPVEFPFDDPPATAQLPRPDLALGEATLRGRVVGPEGAPIADAGVSVLDGPRPAWTWTDADGAFVLAELAPGPARVAVVAQGYVASRLDATVGPDPVELRLDERVPPPPTLPPLDAADLTGSVTFTPLEEPEAGYELALVPTGPPGSLDGGLPRRTRVAADGTFHVEDLLAGEYRVLLLPPDERGALWPDLLAGEDDEPVVLEHAPDAEDGAPAPLELRSRAGAIGGRVADRSRAGRVTWLEGALVTVEPVGADGAPDPTRFRTTRTDAEGAYLLRHLPAGRYTVRLAAGALRRDVAVEVPPEALVDPDL